MRIYTLAAAAMAIIIGGSIALATHDVPSQAKKLKGTWVTSYATCTAPNAMTISLGLPACSPPVHNNPACSFGGVGKGKISIILAGSGANQEIKVKSSLRDLVCADGTVLSLTWSYRNTTDDCSVAPCTVVEALTQDFPTGLSCTVTAGKCDINGVLPPILFGAGDNNVALQKVSLWDGSARTFEMGLLFP